MSEYLHLRCSCAMTLEIARESAGSVTDCPHCGRTMMVPFPDDPDRDRLIGDYAGNIELRPAGPPPRISETLLGVMRSALKTIRAQAPGEREAAAAARRSEEFRDAVLRGIVTPGYRMVDDARRLEIGRSEVGAVVKEVYRAFFRKCLEDGVLSGAEREAMAVVAQRMCLHPAKRAELEAEVTGGLLRERLAAMTLDGRLEPTEGESLRAMVRSAGQAWEPCVREARDVAVRLVEQRFAFARADGRITREEAEEIRRLEEFFGLTGRDVGYVEDELNALRLRTAFQEGSLPVIDAPATVTDLAEDELCHALETVWLAVPTEDGRARAAGAQDGARRGTLLITRRRLRLLGEAGGDLALGGLERPSEEWRAVWQDGLVRRRRFLVLRGGGAEFRVTAHDHDRLSALIAGALHNAARGSAAAPPRAADLSAAARSEVWRRDQGACVQCGATQNLEFAPTVADARLDDPAAFRLLCRACRG